MQPFVVWNGGAWHAEVVRCRARQVGHDSCRHQAWLLGPVLAEYIHVVLKGDSGVQRQLAGGGAIRCVPIIRLLRRAVRPARAPHALVPWQKCIIDASGSGQENSGARQCLTTSGPLSHDEINQARGSETLSGPTASWPDPLTSIMHFIGGLNQSGRLLGPSWPVRRCVYRGRAPKKSELICGVPGSSRATQTGAAAGGGPGGGCGGDGDGPVQGSGEGGSADIEPQTSLLPRVVL